MGFLSSRAGVEDGRGMSEEGGGNISIYFDGMGSERGDGTETNRMWTGWDDLGWDGIGWREDR